MLNVNMTTLINADLNKNLIVDTLADHFGATTQVQVHFQSFLALTQHQVRDQSFLEIISYHTKDRKVHEAAFVAQLLVAKARRANGLDFTKVRCNFDFTPIANKHITAVSTAINFVLPLV